MKLHKSLLLFGTSILLLTACADDGGSTDDSGAAEEPETEEIVEEVEADESEEVDEDEPEEAIEEVEEEDTAEEESVEEDTSNEIILGEPISIGDYTMTIQSYELATDYEGKDALIINYDWVNNSDDTTAPFMTFILKGFQNGVETGDVFMVDGIDLGIGQSEVRPEGVIEGAQAAIGIDDLSQPLELELDELMSFEDNAYTTMIDLSNL